MRVFSCLFNGHYPVGACAVVVADTLEHAKSLLGERLAEQRLALGENDQWEEIQLLSPDAYVLLNGDY